MPTVTADLKFRARRVNRLHVAPDVRAVRIVHEIDGITDAVEPGRLLDVGCGLWDAWLSDPYHSRPDELLGLDAGGFLPTVAVAVVSGLPYRLAWKLDLDLPDKRVFREPHARRTEVFTYGRLLGRRVLVVDDEVTTGRTAGNLVSVLRDAAAEVVGVACLVEDIAGGGRELLESLGVPLCALSTL